MRTFSFLLSLAAIIAMVAPAPAAADYTAGFDSGASLKSPIVIEAGKTTITDSDVGNQNYNLNVFYLAHNASGKTITLERYRVDVYSALDGKVGSRETDLRHSIAPNANDLPFGGEYSEQLVWVNIWGNSISKVVMTPIAVEFDDGTTWKAPTPKPSHH